MCHYVFEFRYYLSIFQQHVLVYKIFQLHFVNMQHIILYNVNVLNLSKRPIYHYILKFYYIKRPYVIMCLNLTREFNHEVLVIKMIISSSNIFSHIELLTIAKTLSLT